MTLVKEFGSYFVGLGFFFVMVSIGLLFTLSMTYLFGGIGMIAALGVLLLVYVFWSKSKSKGDSYYAFDDDDDEWDDD